MRTPTQKQWKTVIEKLYSVLPLSMQDGSGLSMYETEVNSPYHKCGTVHCLGGWYIIAHLREKAFNSELNYMLGAKQLANDLGFRHEFDLEIWAEYNPEIWGNMDGYRIFCSPSAFQNSNQGPAHDLADVIRHFEFVADNCKKIKP
jgi:hypothetical protein